MVFFPILKVSFLILWVYRLSHGCQSINHHVSQLQTGLGARAALFSDIFQSPISFYYHFSTALHCVTLTETMGSLNVQEPDIKPPDGGLRAWLQVLCGHLILFNVWGYINSFGIFQSYYVDALNSSASDVSWVGSLQIFFVYFLGAFSGRATDAGYLRTILVVGLFLQLLGVFMTSLATSYWQILLAQGICQGIGDGLLLCPVVAVVSTYFTTKRTMAISISASGGATGGLVFPAIAQNLLHRIGFPWTVRVMGFVILFNAVIILTFMRQRLPARQKGPLIEWKAFKELSYTLFTCGGFFCFWAVYFAYYYVRGRTPYPFLQSKTTLTNNVRHRYAHSAATLSTSPTTLPSRSSWS